MTTPEAPRSSTGAPRGNWLASMWLYSVLRFGLFFGLWGLLVLAGLQAFFAAVLALVLSVPLSLVLLARPRARFAAQIEERLNAHKQERARLDAELSGEDGGATDER